MWYGETFTVADIAEAADWLHQNGLTDCADVAGNVAPMFAGLTEAGVMCAEEFGSHTDQYVAWRRQAQAETQGQVPPFWADRQCRGGARVTPGGGPPCSPGAEHRGQR